MPCAKTHALAAACYKMPVALSNQIMSDYWPQ